MRSLPVLVVALFALTLVVVPAVGAPGETGSTPTALDGERTATEFEPAAPHTVIEVNVTDNGDARWSITYRYVVTGDNETTAFRQFGENVANGDEAVGFSPRTFQQFATQAEAWTGRDMRVVNAGWEEVRLAERQPENGTTTTRATTTGTGAGQTTAYVGELTYSFTWTNFAEVRQDTIVVGDAFGTEDQTWFNRLYEGQRLIIDGPANYGIRDSPDDKGPNNGTLRWDGPVDFEPGYIDVTYFDPGTEPIEGISPILVGAGVGLLVVVVAAGAYLFASRRTDREPGQPTTTPNGGKAAASGTTDGGSSSGGPVVERSRSGTGPAEPSADVDGDDSDEEAESIDSELLSDEERVLRLLDENGGRMKQANIVKETGWSNAKVSQLLSGMDEDDEIQKLRIGRENLITLPDENVGDFDDDR
ncbi:helix-turn-helix transcriptional regulator [Haloarchaeobius sp. HRN-SO-5]|uniref:helix-turn-helix transcriptional regulator n=1 Tax=Haloarchaeobius sp. HRN-SO-5 TaxID=3446118 RepID=UPI003EBF08A4